MRTNHLLSYEKHAIHRLSLLDDYAVKWKGLLRKAHLQKSLKPNTPAVEEGMLVYESSFLSVLSWLPLLQFRLCPISMALCTISPVCTVCKFYNTCTQHFSTHVICLGLNPQMMSLIYPIWIDGFDDGFVFSITYLHSPVVEVSMHHQ